MNKPGTKTILSLALAALSVIIYAGALSNGFVYDDRAVVLENPWLKGGATGLWRAFFTSVWDFEGGHSTSDYYRPMLHVLFFFIHKAFAFKAWGWHLASILIHALNVILLFLIGNRIFERTGARRALLFSFLGAALFALHPVNTEAVAWVSCLTELSYAFFFLLATYLYMISEERRGPAYLFSLLSFFISMLFKEPAIVLPAVLLAYDAGSKKVILSNIKRYIPYPALAVVYLLLRSNALSGTGRALFIHDPFLQLLTGFPVMAHYIGKMLFPASLSVFPVVDHLRSISGREFLLPFAITLLFIPALIWTAFRVARPSIFFSAIMLVPIAPTFYLLFQNTDIYNISLAAERYLYLPLSGFAMLAALYLEKISSRYGKRGLSLSMAIALMITGLYALRTVARVPDWKDDKTLWMSTMEEEPENYFAHFMAAQQYLKEGDRMSAEKELKEAVRLRPSFTGGHHSLGLIYYDSGRTVEAEKEFEEVLKVNPVNKDALYNLALIKMDRGEWDKAIETLEKALARLKGKDSLRALNALAVSYAKTGETEKSIALLKKARSIDPADRETIENLNALGVRE